MKFLLISEEAPLVLVLAIVMVWSCSSSQRRQPPYSEIEYLLESPGMIMVLVMVLVLVMLLIIKEASSELGKREFSGFGGGARGRARRRTSPLR